MSNTNDKATNTPSIQAEHATPRIPKNSTIDFSTENNCRAALIQYFREHDADMGHNPISRRLYDVVLGEDLDDDSRKVLTQIFIKSKPPEDLEVADDDCLMIENARGLLLKTIATPPELIHGILYQGGKMSFNGPSKMGKTWSLLNLGISLNAGLDWFGFKTTESRVLFINPELQNFSFEKRIQSVAKGLSATLDNFDYLSTRGKDLSSSTLLPLLKKKVKAGRYGAIILDSIYKLYPDKTEENSSSDIGRFLYGLERLADKTGSAIIYSHHFSKGNQAHKAAIDRSSGAGAWGRDPDAIVSVTEHEKENCYGVEFNLRDFKPVEPFTVRVAFPNIFRDTSLDPKALKTTQYKAKYTETDFLRVLSVKPYTASELQKELKGELGMSSGTFYSLWADVKKSAGVTKDNENRWCYIVPASNPSLN
jgi:hypothetical protein